MDIIDIDDEINIIEFSADLLVKRLNDVRYLVFLVENYYSLKEIPYRKSRHEALISVIGNEHDYSYIRRNGDDSTVDSRPGKYLSNNISIYKYITISY